MKKILLDTSVVVPALLHSHPNHAAADLWITAGQQGRCQLFVALHSVTEAFSVLTRLPTHKYVPADEVWNVIEQTLLPAATIVEVAANDVLAKLRWCASQQLAGGILYDALIALAAETADVDLLLTYNTRHFLQVLPTAVDRIHVPDAALLPKS